MISPTDDDIGRAVLYRQEGRKGWETELGRISSFNDQVVFVRFTTGSTAAPCQPGDLAWESEAPDGTNYLDRMAGEYVLKGFVPQVPQMPVGRRPVW
jgi:hypothetical protein